MTYFHNHSQHHSRDLQKQSSNFLSGFTVVIALEIEHKLAGTPRLNYYDPTSLLDVEHFFWCPQWIICSKLFFCFFPFNLFISQRLSSGKTNSSDNTAADSCTRRLISSHFRMNHIFCSIFQHIACGALLKLLFLRHKSRCENVSTFPECRIKFPNRNWKILPRGATDFIVKHAESKKHF